MSIKSLIIFKSYNFFHISNRHQFVLKEIIEIFDNFETVDIHCFRQEKIFIALDKKRYSFFRLLWRFGWNNTCSYEHFNPNNRLFTAVMRDKLNYNFIWRNKNRWDSKIEKKNDQATPLVKLES